MTTDLLADLRTALDPVAFARELGFGDLDPWQPQALRWSGKRLLLCVHRQGGKSTVAAVLALHQACYFPQSLTLLVSPSLRQSVELFRKTRDLMERMPDPPQLVEDNKTACCMESGSRIVSLPSSESTVRGYSNVALAIEDESARVHDDLHKSIRPMLAVSDGRLVMMSTPFGRRGHFYEAWNSVDSSWERIRAVAEECPRISREFLDEERRALGALWYRQEYECEFVEAESQVFARDLIDRAITTDVQPVRIRSRWGIAVAGGER